MAELDIINLVLNEILRIDISTINSYQGVQEQLLYLVLIPHVVILLFIYLFSTVISLGHMGFRNLIGIAAYLTIIIAGWYGILVPIVNAWWTIIIVGYLFLFIMSKIIPASMLKELMGLGSAVATKATAKGKKRKQYEKELEVLENQIAAIDQQIAASQGNPTAQAMLTSQRQQYEAAKLKLEKELESVGG